MSTLRHRAALIAVTGTLALGGVVAGATAAGAAPSACGNTALAVYATRTQGATGHGSFVLSFKNTSHTTCTLYGYPGLDAVNASGRVIAHAARTLHGFAGGAHTERTVTLAPGAYGSATVEWMNFNPVTSGPCAFSKTVAVTPANTSHTVHFLRQVSVCELQVHPTVAGTSGNN